MGMEKSLEKIGANGMSIRGSIEQLHSLGAFGRLLEIIWGVIGGHTSKIGDLARSIFLSKNDNTIDLDYPCALQNTLVFSM